MLNCGPSAELERWLPRWLLPLGLLTPESALKAVGLLRAWEALIVPESACPGLVSTALVHLSPVTSLAWLLKPGLLPAYLRLLSAAPGLLSPFASGLCWRDSLDKG